jgi:hypothetical protein
MPGFKGMAAVARYPAQENGAVAARGAVRYHTERVRP